MQLETDPMVLERLREKANPTPEERYVLKWMDDTKSDNEHNALPSEEQQQGVATTPATVIISRARNLRNFFTARFTTKRS